MPALQLQTETPYLEDTVVTDHTGRWIIYVGATVLGSTYDKPQDEANAPPTSQYDRWLDRPRHRDRPRRLYRTKYTAMVLNDRPHEREKRLPK